MPTPVVRKPVSSLTSVWELGLASRLAMRHAHLISLDFPPFPTHLPARNIPINACLKPHVSGPTAFAADTFGSSWLSLCCNKPCLTPSTLCVPPRT